MTELLSPAGNFEKMDYAIRYGADAVYLAGEGFGLRAKAGNFDNHKLEEALRYLQRQGKRGYVTVNAYLRTEEFDDLRKYLGELEDLAPDALIVSDPGVFAEIRRMGLKTPVHISTQANVTNLSAVNFWADMGAERVILARELDRDELKRIAAGAKAEIEVFVHGAMCISMSGRCLMSNYMTGRDANAGLCTHPCRWKFALMEEQRPGEYFPVEEDERGTYFFNSKDLCLIDYIGDLVSMGIKSLKIEGRMKSVMYAAVTTGVYRQALDKALEDPYNYVADPGWLDMLKSVSHRDYTQGFYNGYADMESMNYGSSNYIQECDFLGSVDEKGLIHARNRFERGEELEIVSPDMSIRNAFIEELMENGDTPMEAARPNYRYTIGEELKEGSILRRCRR
ncbi:peptidase U32 family protein [Limisalsivibrio acetivorans]|uniref:peptidase U32 family protein n=1 Tax=Limisalsivibrio acetivorans TaxID=1304888 RepID=UPI0003B3E7F0|nr:U32 family peptidase [Limisalsivibrio acetivorans]